MDSIIFCISSTGSSLTQISGSRFSLKIGEPPEPFMLPARKTFRKWMGLFSKMRFEKCKMFATER